MYTLLVTALFIGQTPLPAPQQQVLYTVYVPIAGPNAPMPVVAAIIPTSALTSQPHPEPVCAACQTPPDHFLKRLMTAYRNEFCPPEKPQESEAKAEKKDDKDAKADSKAKDEKKKEDDAKPNEPPAEPEKPRRAFPAPFASPPFPSAEWVGFPLIGVPKSDSEYPLMKAINGGPFADHFRDSGAKIYGWINAAGNWSTNDVSNAPSLSWIPANRLTLNQFVVRFEKEADTVQQDHIDFGYRMTCDFGTDYRYFTAGGWFSDQLLVHNFLYGWDMTEKYVTMFVPGIAEGMVVTAGRWLSCPDIESQFAPDNYLSTRSMLVTLDVVTQTGIMAAVMLDKQWTVHAGLHAGADMAPWYEGAMPAGMFGVRWVSCDNYDSVYASVNAINDAEFQYFTLNGQPAGHHNFNIYQMSWQHKFNDCTHTKFESYVLWERNAPVGNTTSIGPFQYGNGGGLGPTVPGLSLTYGLLNLTAFKLTDKDYFTVRNEWLKDEHGTRSGFAGNYSSNTIGLCHNFNSVLQVRPEIGYYRNWNTPAFDNGAKQGMTLYGLDVTLRF